MNELDEIVHKSCSEYKEYGSCEDCEQLVAKLQAYCIEQIDKKLLEIIKEAPPVVEYDVIPLPTFKERQSWHDKYLKPYDAFINRIQLKHRAGLQSPIKEGGQKNG